MANRYGHGAADIGLFDSGAGVYRLDAVGTVAEDFVFLFLGDRPAKEIGRDRRPDGPIEEVEYGVLISGLFVSHGGIHSLISLLLYYSCGDKPHAAS